MILGAALLVLLLVVTAPAQAQEGPLRLVGPEGQEHTVTVVDHRGYAAASSTALERLGWRLEPTARGARAHLDDRVRLDFTAGSPFFSWNGEVLQLASPPYVFGDRLHLPLQLFTGFLPRRLSDEYAVDEAAYEVRVREPRRWASARDEGPGGGDGPARAPDATVDEAVVVIDPGHGGRDTGARGAGGVVEKEVALGVALALARELDDDPAIEVHLTRSDDRFVPLWERGERATEWKGDRPGVFVSLHANAAARSGSRGFETYFLSEARTEHERRVAALENAPARLEDGADGPGLAEDADLNFILNDLRNRDHQHWSALLAELVQGELGPVHPGPDRGVKQGPFAVITNALMPGILVELGFLSNEDEARAMTTASFQRDAAGAIARALRDFFRRYPPGSGLEAAVGAGAGS